MTKTGITSRWICMTGGLLAVVAALALSPGTAWPVNVDLQVVVNTPTDDVVSSLNPSSARFDLVYEAGDLKTADGSTTVGSFLLVVVRSTKANANYFDGVLIFPTGNVYVKLTHNFATGARRGILVGGDGTFAGVTGTIVQISGIVYRFTVP